MCTVLEVCVRRVGVNYYFFFAFILGISTETFVWFVLFLVWCLLCSIRHKWVASFMYAIYSLYRIWLTGLNVWSSRRRSSPGQTFQGVICRACRAKDFLVTSSNDSGFCFLAATCFFTIDVLNKCLHLYAIHLVCMRCYSLYFCHNSHNEP